MGCSKKKYLVIAAIVVLLLLLEAVFCDWLIAALQFLSHHIGMDGAFVLLSFGMVVMAFILTWLLIRKS